MEDFYKIPSVLKILLIELVAVFFFPITVAGIVNEIWTGIFPAFNDFQGVGDWLTALVGPLFVAWVVYDILRPRIKDEIWGKFFRVKFKFCSTHPSYVLIDFLTIAFASFFLWIGLTGGFATPVFLLMLATSLAFPVLRLLAWYLFRLKIADTETQDAYKPALSAFGIFSVIVGGTALGAALI